MDGDGSSNAVAGPSTLPDAILCYLPPAGPSRPPPYFKSTEDLLSKFQLLSAYDSHVRPFLQPEDMSPDKGKGKQWDMSPTPDSHSVHINDPDDDEIDRRKRKKNNYKHLIKGIPGKHSTKKDDFLTTTMQVPPKQRITIVPFDSATQRDAFSVGLDGLKGWNVNTLISETPQAREDRRRKKELKKLAKSHANQRDSLSKDEHQQ